MARVANASRPERSAILTLRRRADFDRVFSTGTRRKYGPVVVVTARGTEDAFRFGLVASKKIGSAVARNRVKRRIRHAIRAADPRPGADAIVIGSGAVLSVPFGDLVGCLAQAVGSRTNNNLEQENRNR